MQNFRILLFVIIVALIPAGIGFWIDEGPVNPGAKKVVDYDAK